MGLDWIAFVSSGSRRRADHSQLLNFDFPSSVVKRVDQSQKIVLLIKHDVYFFWEALSEETESNNQLEELLLCTNTQTELIPREI